MSKQMYQNDNKTQFLFMSRLIFLVGPGDVALPLAGTVSGRMSCGGAGMRMGPHLAGFDCPFGGQMAVFVYNISGGARACRKNYVLQKLQ
jgi:hypothetical protein